MAFVHRTTRDTSKANAKYETPTHVGPGAYRIRSTFGPVRPSYAPFGSTGVRKTVTEQVKLVTPGPGTYDEFSKPGLGVTGTASAFRSATLRFTSPALRDKTPGPGQYNAKTSLRIAARRNNMRGRKKLTSYTARAPNSAPSIPGKDDQFGYDETSDGRLRKQLAPKKGFKGRDGDTVGPGEYDTRRDIGRYAKGGADFGRSTSIRDDSKAADAAHLGPGCYDVTADKVPRRAPTPSGSFKSSTARSDPAGEAAHVYSPGPGAYAVRSSFKVCWNLVERFMFYGITLRN